MLSLLSLLAPTLAAAPATQEGADLFEAEVAPILEAHCLACHGGDTRKGGVAFTDDELPEGLVAQGRPGESLLLELVSGPSPEMPMKAPPLSEDEVATLRRWIEAGAPWAPGVVGAGGNG